jgi:hypothetical protein
MTQYAAAVSAVALHLVLAALALAPAQSPAQPKGNPRLAALEIELWPEYDRASAALVILKAEISPDIPLPAQVTLRIPAASGGPHAVAYSEAPGSPPLNLSYRKEEAGGAILLRLEAPARNFLVEFYEPLSTALAARNYTYTWPGDFAAGRVIVSVQEPAQSSGLEVKPPLDRSITGGNGMRYRTADLGPLPAGTAMPVAVRYSKPDARTSAEILNLKSGAAAEAAVSPAQGVPAARGSVPIELIAAMLAVVVAMVSAILLFARWKERSPSRSPLPRGACTQCGAPRREGDRFCGKCGAKLG